MFDKEVNNNIKNINIQVNPNDGLFAIAAVKLLEFAYRNSIGPEGTAKLWNNAMKMIEYAGYELAVLKQEREKEQENEDDSV